MEKEMNVPVQPAEEKAVRTPYTTRPLWRPICAWIGLALFIGAVAFAYFYLTQGGF